MWDWRDWLRITPPILPSLMLSLMLSRARFIQTSLLLMLATVSSLQAEVSSAATKYPKVLFLGNSITKHGPSTKIDWLGNWGMAATAEDKDYVHLVTQGLTKKQGIEPAILIKNISDFERGYVGYSLEEKMADVFSFQADLIIIAIGENVPAVTTDEAKTNFKAAVLKLLQKLKGPQNPTILVRSCFWTDAAKNLLLKQACEEVGGIFVDISAMSKDESNFARSERPYKHEGVAKHPGNKGMKGIAEAILAAIP